MERYSKKTLQLTGQLPSQTRRIVIIDTYELDIDSIRDSPEEIPHLSILWAIALGEILGDEQLDTRPDLFGVIGLFRLAVVGFDLPGQLVDKLFAALSALVEEPWLEL